MYNSSTIVIYLIALFIFLVGIAAITEVYKKIIRKDKYSTIEVKIVATVLSTVTTFCMNKLNLIYNLFNQINAPQWINPLFYGIVIYFCQYIIDMNVIKKIVKYSIFNILRKLNFTEEQIRDILK